MNAYTKAKDRHQLSWEYNDKLKGWYLSCGVCRKGNFRFLSMGERNKYLPDHSTTKDFTKLEEHLLQTYLMPHMEEPQHSEKILLEQLAGENT